MWFEIFASTQSQAVILLQIYFEQYKNMQGRPAAPDNLTNRK